MAGKAPYPDEEILHRFADMVYRLALSQIKNKSDAEDIFQEVFLRYVRTNTDFESEEHVKAWLIRVTLNCCRNLWNSAWFRKTVPLEETLQIKTAEESGLLEAVSTLPIKYRSIIHMYYYEDMPVKEISAVLQKPESTITSQLYRARKLLQKNLKGDIEL